MTLKTISSAGTHDAPVPALRESHGVTTSAQAATVRGALTFPVPVNNNWQTPTGSSLRVVADRFNGATGSGRAERLKGSFQLPSHLLPHPLRQGGYCGPCLHNSRGTKTNKMRKTNLGTMNQVPWERVEVPQGSLLTALAWLTLFTQGIAQPRASIDKRLVIASKSDPTAGGQSRQAHSPLSLRQSVSST